ncbi:electron-transferring-flavoprotein dehydrogenase [Sporothrix brasiliensis 5110]|uniref:Probable electron transfer flavoprotein-ubiquinone oxidoreductase, mitochondrial n=1 Tax=Sporothrix brasiliensis 5110 TaxID=1398154 RepID=A0A0C2JB42_9PEZI|nr:electron-transferring-flavoprotein dehydrogenase [Sporothrix brasiliensis 5110]KIH94102.1 electron-transferring-flavoprotein dehydrogenase [Sporothrix brasiliensis 5110]
MFTASASSSPAVAVRVCWTAGRRRAVLPTRPAAAPQNSYSASGQVPNGPVRWNSSALRCTATPATTSSPSSRRCRTSASSSHNSVQAASRPRFATGNTPKPIPTPYFAQTRFFSESRRRRMADVVADEDSFDPKSIERESDMVDVCIIGGGPAGLSAAIRLKQLATEAGNEDFRVLLLEKAGELGAHTMSGAVIQPDAINDLIPNWLDEDNPDRFEFATPAGKDSMKFLTKTKAFPLPIPPQMHNDGNYIVSLNQYVSWLGARAEEAGVEVYPGFAASEVLYAADGSVSGVATNDVGIGRDGKPKDSFERGMEFHARVTLFAEGCHGSLTKQVIKKFDLRRDSDPQTYGLGIKEVWEVRPEVFEKGKIVHAMGYPLPYDLYGGGFMYHFGDNLVTLGLVTSLDYKNPWLSPYNEFQRMKQHPLFRSVLEGGKCISYGARAIIEGGLQSVPKVAFPGGAIIGDSAGFVNVPKIKGTHNAMRSGMLAAEAAWNALKTGSTAAEGEGEAENQDDDGQSTVRGDTVFLYEYEEALRKSSIWKELHEVRNMRPSFQTPLGMYGGVLYSGIEAIVLKGRMPWTLHHRHADHETTKPASQYKKIDYPKPDGEITFDILTSVSRTGTNHEEDQPVHLQVKDWEKHTTETYPEFQGLENRFCPAGVYEYIEDNTKPEGVRFQINAQNCIHCKTCDIKAPKQDINWQVPQGGEGPKYYMT